MPLLLLFVVLPLIEITLFIKVGGLIGLWPTLAIIVGTAVLGTWLLRRQGSMALRDVQRAFVEFRDPTAPLAQGALILVAGVLLVSPGFFTDTLGFLLLIPPVRAAVIRALGSRMRVSRAGFGFPPEAPAHRYGRGAVIDAEYVDETPADPAAPGAPASPADGARRRPSGWTRTPGAPDGLH